ncbi:uncharacterized protein B0J16DRAFT_336390 [Fusarium flagelliforme]|uniref:uncharacterized protein n=1 Tax=Fusarium flagelliforme TaxID=2675880 RepID=UPI001E8CED93|nr:uncharacterized protein B0J16DRAFT_336390 [Fusarium flagelliforme]KAH7188031.1 hypothetical protein B0J16DRAFT_336390 [Fusarium flagelliforme]
MFAIDEQHWQLNYKVSAKLMALDVIGALVWQFGVTDTITPLLSQRKPEALASFAQIYIIFHFLGGNPWSQRCFIWPVRIWIWVTTSRGY